MISTLLLRSRSSIITVMLLLASALAFGQQLPEKPSPPRLVNDFAHMLTEGEQAQLERKLEDFEKETSNEITIVTVPELGDYDVSDYAIKLGKAWGIGKSGRNNGVVILASLNDHKINISTGKGLEGALTDLACGRIIRREMVPAFKDHQYYTGFSKAADAVLAAAKGEYKADAKDRKAKHVPAAAIIIIIIIIVFIIKMTGRGGGGGGGGRYISGGGFGDFLGGMIIGNILSGGGRHGGGGGWGGGDSGGGFGGFGGGDFGGGGASGSW